MRSVPGILTCGLTLFPEALFLSFAGLFFSRINVRALLKILILFFRRLKSSKDAILET